MMKHERPYRLLAWGVMKTLPRLNFDIEWQKKCGHEFLWLLNALGAKWIYEGIMIHFYDRKTIVYTACKELPNWVETTDDVSEVTCVRCKEILSERKGLKRNDVYAASKAFRQGGGLYG